MQKIIVKEIIGNPKRLSVHLHFFQKEERDLLKRYIPGRSWNPDTKEWTIPYTKDSIAKLLRLFPTTCQLNFKIRTDIPKKYEGVFSIYTPPNHDQYPPPPNPPKQPLTKHQKALDALEQELILRRYSYSTIKSYKAQLRKLLSFYKDKPPSQITLAEIKQFLLHRIKTENIAERTQKQAINAIKYYYEKVLKKEKMFIDLKGPKIPKDLPTYLSPQEVSKLFQAVNNLKHRAILLTIYAAGLRVSEVCNLKITDIRTAENYIFIQGGKGKKDRTTILSPVLLIILREYYKLYRPQFYLFEGLHGGAYSKRSVQVIMNRAVAKSKVRHATPHTLRHSFATHLVQSGTDISYVKDLLGHTSVKTTEIYLHLTKKDLRCICSPLDHLIDPLK